MEIIIGLVIMAAGIGFAIYQTRKMNKLNLEIQSMETSKIADAIEIVNTLSETDSNYRHYVELKGNIFTKEKVIAPFTEREAHIMKTLHMLYQKKYSIIQMMMDITEQVLRKMRRNYLTNAVWFRYT